MCGAHGGDLKPLSDAPNVWAEISLVESAQTLRSAVEALVAERVVFGSHSPFMYFEAVAAKLDVASVDVPPEVVDAVRSGNAEALLAGSRGN